MWSGALPALEKGKNSDPGTYVIKQSVKQFTFTQLNSIRFYEGQCRGKFSSLGRVAVSHTAQIPPQPDVETIAKAKPSVAADSS